MYCLSFMKTYLSHLYPDSLATLQIPCYSKDALFFLSTLSTIYQPILQLEIPS